LARKEPKRITETILLDRKNDFFVNYKVIAQAGDPETES
jgi:hypothetical protein